MFEVGKKYRRKGGALVSEVLCLGKQMAFAVIVSSDVNNGQEHCLMTSEFPLYEEYKPPVVVERYVGIYAASYYSGNLMWDTLVEAKQGVANSAVGIAKYTWTDGKITSITICD